jgi:uracil-DNA glycosylase family 4
LSGFLAEVRREHPDYHARPVAPFGDDNPRLLIVGLAPGMHGANRTGRPFTGDHAGILLYRTLHKFGFATAAQSAHAADGLKLIGCRVTNAVKCLPPQNKPELREIRQCNGYLQSELKAQKKGSAVLALGIVAHQAVLLALGLKKSGYPFGHGASYRLPNGLTLYDSYHCSRYNTQTRRLTENMFNQVFAEITNNLH